MVIRFAERLTTRRLDDPEANESPRSEVLLDGHAVGIVLRGATLETAIEQDGMTLLFMTDDTPFEEVLSLHLLSPEMRLLDSAYLGFPYSTGTFALLGCEGNVARFRFFGGCDWTVELLPRPQRRVPLLGEPRGVWRRFGFSRHFVVRGNPQPEDRRRANSP